MLQDFDICPVRHTSLIHDLYINLRAIDTLEVNIANQNFPNYGKNDLKSFNKDIIDLKLDIICLQEVDKNSLRSGNFDMLKIMANSSGYCYYYFYPTM